MSESQQKESQQVMLTVETWLRERVSDVYKLGSGVGGLVEVKPPAAQTQQTLAICNKLQPEVVPGERETAFHC